MLTPCGPHADLSSAAGHSGLICEHSNSANMQVGRLWCALSDFYVRQGLFERARDVYQEGIESVVTVRDFGIVFTALTNFEQALVQAQVDAQGDEIDAVMAPDDDGADFLLKDDGGDVDLRLDRLDWLLARRPLLLNSVMLRQNPHNVQARAPL